MDKTGLKNMVIESAARGAAWRKEIQATTDRARYDAWTEKRSVGLRTRRLLLAYAFVRGMPYAVVEAPGHMTADAANELAYDVAIGLDLDTPVGTRDEIKAWLLVPATPERLQQIKTAQRLARITAREVFLKSREALERGAFRTDARRTVTG